MSAPPNDTTKFELAWLIIWILVSVFLLALAVLRKLSLPNVIKGDKTFSIIFGFLQLVIFTLLLAALAHNQWSRVSYPGGWTAFGVAGTHDSAGNNNEYDCSNGSSDVKNYCRTIAAAGAFTLIFGLVGILVAAALLVLVVLSLLGQGALAQFNVHVPVLSNVQWICMQAMIIIWGVSGHDALHQGNSSIKLGDSWALCFVAAVLAIVAALFFAGGPGASATGSTGQPAVSAGPTQQQQQHHHQSTDAQPTVVVQPA